MNRSRADKHNNPYELRLVVEHYLETHPWVSSYEKAGAWIAHKLVQVLKRDPLRILEIGSGGGELVLSLSKEFSSIGQSYRICLVEPSSLMRRSSAHSQVEADPAISVCLHHFPARGCADEEQSFDCLISVLSLHHIPKWRDETDRIFQKSDGRMAVVLGIAIGDAVLVSTGITPDGPPSHDNLGAAFWAEYHSYVKSYLNITPGRPSDLTPWDYTPALSHFRAHGFRTTAVRRWEVDNTLTYETLLSWIEDGALTSLLAFGDDIDRRAMADHMRSWLLRRSVSPDDEWQFKGGVHIEIMGRTV